MIYILAFIAIFFTPRIRAQGPTSAQDQEYTYFPTLRLGKADLIGFGGSATFALRNGASSTIELLADFAVSEGWNNSRHLRFIADATGDGRRDIIGFGGQVFISVQNTDGTFQPVHGVGLQAFCFPNMTLQDNPRLVADMFQSGRVDLVAFADDGVQIARNLGNLAFGSPNLVVNDFGTTQGWSTAEHPRFLGDLNGDGFIDIIGFGESNVNVSFNLRGASFTPSTAVLNQMAHNSSDGPWLVEKHPRFVADINGDGAVDLVGFGNAGVFVSYNNGSGAFTDVQLAVQDFGVVSGWSIQRHLRFLTDITGDGKPDIVGFGEVGVVVALNNGDGTFMPSKVVLQDFGAGSTAGSWNINTTLRFLADMNGDGRADIVGMDDTQTVLALSLGNGTFGPKTFLTNDFTSSNGYTIASHIRTVANL